MKKHLLAFAICAVGTVQAQHQSFEFFSPKDLKVKPKWLEQAVPSNKDNQGRIWSVSGTLPSIVLNNDKDTQKVHLQASVLHKMGYTYKTDRVIVDENDSKIVLVRGIKTVGFRYYYDDYIVKRNTGGLTSYLFLKDLGITDTTARIDNVQSIGDRFLIYAKDSLIWQGTELTKLRYRGERFYTDKINTLFAIGNQTDGLYSFYADGTYQHRLETLYIKDHYFDPQKNTLVVSTFTSGIYELNADTEESVTLPRSAQLRDRWGLDLERETIGSVTIHLSLSKTGFNIRTDTSSTTFLFSEMDSLNRDSLSYCANTTLQEDSTLVIVYAETAVEVPDLIYYYHVFTYKDGVANFHKKYLVAAYNLEGYTAAYISPERSLFYVDARGSVVQFDNDSIREFSYQDLSCELIISDMVADHDYLWAANSYQQNNDNPCAIARLRHSDLVTSLGLQSIEQAGLFPNPAKDRILLPSDVTHAVLYDALGNELVHSTSPNMDLGSIPNGVYLVKMLHQKGNLSTQKLSVVK